MIVALAVAGLVFWLAFDGGAYGLESRATVAIAIWWTIVMAVALGLWPLARPSRPAFVTGGLLAGLAVLTTASMAWAPSAERAFAEFDRVALYLGVYLLAVLAGTRGNAGRWSDGIAAGVAVAGLLALASRLFPDVLPRGDVPTFLPSAYARLSYPVEYWNGLAILVALVFPLLFRAAVASPRLGWRALAVASLPALSATLYLTSSRGGVAAAILGTGLFVLFTERRWAALGAIAVAGLGSIGAIAVLLARSELVNDPFDSTVATAQGRSAAALLVVICLATGLAYALATRYLARGVRIPAVAGRLVSVVVVVLALSSIAASDPVERFETFKRPPGELTQPQRDFVQAHLLSGNGSGRWQFWSAAVDEFESRPLLGRGAGSYEAWWAQNGSIAMFVRDAHSLYLETLGELGVLGFLLVVAAFLVGIATAGARLLRSRGEERTMLTALAAGFLAYAFAAGIDWMWELTVVSAVGIAFLGLLTGPATEQARRPRLLLRPQAASPGRRRFAAGVTAVVAGWLLICAEAIPLLAQVKIGDSQAAVDRGDADAARSAADAARRLQPWAASPYLQLGLVEEQTGELGSARGWIREAIEHDPENWRLWLVAARIETKTGAIAAARRSLARAAELNPRSPLFAEIRS